MGCHCQGVGQEHDDKESQQTNWFHCHVPEATKMATLAPDPDGFLGTLGHCKSVVHCGAAIPSATFILTRVGGTVNL